MNPDYGTSTSFVISKLFVGVVRRLNLTQKITLELASTMAISCNICERYLLGIEPTTTALVLPDIRWYFYLDLAQQLLNNLVAVNIVLAHVPDINIHAGISHVLKDGGFAL